MNKTSKYSQSTEFLYKNLGTPGTEVLSGIFIPLLYRGLFVWGLLGGLMSLHIPKWYMLYFGGGSHDCFAIARLASDAYASVW